jgi:hypothetical protein
MALCGPFLITVRIALAQERAFLGGEHHPSYLKLKIKN